MCRSRRGPRGPIAAWHAPVDAVFNPDRRCVYLDLLHTHNQSAGEGAYSLAGRTCLPAPPLVRRLLQRGAFPEAVSLARRHVRGPHFARSLEWLLFTALENDTSRWVFFLGAAWVDAIGGASFCNVFAGTGAMPGPERARMRTDTTTLNPAGLQAAGTQHLAITLICASLPGRTCWAWLARALVIPGRSSAQSSKGQGGSRRGVSASTSMQRSSAAVDAAGAARPPVSARNAGWRCRTLHSATSVNSLPA